MVMVTREKYKSLIISLIIWSWWIYPVLEENTWYRPNGKAKSRLDRFLISFEWLQQWPGSKQYVLDRQISDHCALVLKSNVVDWGPKPFRFLDIWQEDKEFENFIKSKWESYLVQGNEIIVLKEKLKMLKSDL